MARKRSGQVYDRNCRGMAAITVLGLTSGVLAAEPPQPAAVESYRSMGDYGYPLDASKRSGSGWEPFKAIRLNEIGSVDVSFGGEVRYRFENLRNDAFNLSGDAPRNSYLLQRILIHGDLHIGQHLRLFGQFGSYLAFGSRYDLGPTQADPAELAQGFAEMKLPFEQAGTMTLRGGRQEMLFGSSRLVSIRESPNVHRAFDGLRVTFEVEKWSAFVGWKVDGFVTRPVQNVRYSFNDPSNPGQLFTGIYATGPFLQNLIPSSRIDLYYLNLARNQAEFAQGTAFERRHSTGGRLSGKANSIDWDVEGLYQFGTFARRDIQAWTATADIGYSFEQLPWKPRLGMKASIASGDRRPNDMTLGTFNPLFPKLPYFSEASVIAPMNLMGVQPGLTVSPTEDLEILVSLDMLKKNKANDAVYSSTLTPYEGSEGGSRDIGRIFQSIAEWHATRELTLRAGYVHVYAGQSLKQSGGRDVDLAFASAALKF